MDKLFSAFDGDEELDSTLEPSSPAKASTSPAQTATAAASTAEKTAVENDKISEDKETAPATKRAHQEENEDGDGDVAMSGEAAPAKRQKTVSADANESAPADSVLAEHQEESQENDAAEATVEKPPAKTYPFTLDGFQREAIGYLERNESVLVAAHTSAGKTVVAEYAIAMALRDKKRVVYTSPIKALSNQKYRDLADEFEDVGLMTGDVTINPHASCLVMTTEILRSMLYRGSEVIREVAYAVFDEVHYMRDRERGVVWEEAILLLPHKVRFVFLSATIPNAQQFCDWISKTHFQPCHAVYTDYRPTPLQHYVYPASSTGVYLIVDEKGKFHVDTFEKAMSSMSSSNLEDAVDEASKSKEAKKRMMARRRDKMGDLLSIIQMIMQRNYDPAIVFSFSKKDCEKYAAQLSKLSLNTEDDKAMVRKVFKNAIEALNEDDKDLPQVRSLLPLLERGIGIHHGGLLPILKEVTEILFGEGLLKVLFATETFAMGINMPAKTVVFSAMRKFDGSDFRFVSPGEYIQMSGRAGRRGLDDRGIVIQMMDEPMETAQAKEIMSGQANPLSSSFYLTYNMLLNLMRVDDADPEFVIRNSLYTFQQESQIPELEADLRKLEAKLEAMQVDREDEVANYNYLKSQCSQKEAQVASLVMRSDVVGPFLKPGRLVQINDGWGWAVILQVKRGREDRNVIASVEVVVASDPSNPGLPFVAPQDETDTKDVSSGKGRRKNNKRDRPVRPEPAVREISLENLLQISTLRVHMPTGNQVHDTLLRSMLEVKRRHPEGVPCMSPVKDLKVKDPKLPVLLQNLTSLQAKLEADPIQSMTDLVAKRELVDAFMQKFNVRIEIKLLKKEIRNKKSLPMKDKLKSMKVVLRRLGHVDKDGVIQLKGRVGCEISTADELILTELLLGGSLNELTPAHIASLLSCLVFTENGESEDPVPDELAPLYENLQKVAKRIGVVQNDANIPTDPEEFAKKFRSDLMNPVFQWCKGARFSQICELTSVFEGTIIRCVRRLVELLRQLAIAARVIGDVTMEQKFAKAVDLIKRDIIFAASLYL
ncbi:DExH-box ATP-dependent RNA helicase DExH9 [Hondaea fermentalgiana]|uniref:DExH-box ATP-dependent RNA helicase DExH9 n=1 Tax=Hondaea fermentalgiana TaxID=2315210 RepID=A0A2R5GB94_9STRA|nr:DExH-box ATP-dependent RNA helicase DExH9 [Hondaea fermentalgiana]|eukprot:GBG24974.1 DExH-box ATP-dependent RNA helicase DExH9 [Hondaea fermentalgiana]